MSSNTHHTKRTNAKFIEGTFCYFRIEQNISEECLSVRSKMLPCMSNRICSASRYRSQAMLMAALDFKVFQCGNVTV